jgi:hypothetical protein
MSRQILILVINVMNDIQNANPLNLNNNALPAYKDILKQLNQLLIDCPDVIGKRVVLQDGKEGCLLYVKGLIDLTEVYRLFVTPLLTLNLNALNNRDNIDKLPIAKVSCYYNIQSISDEIFKGSTILIVDGLSFALGAKLNSVTKRNISEPQGEKSLKGSHEGFIEDVETNISLLRRIINSSSLKFKTLETGHVTKQRIIVAYIDEIANGKILNALLTKLNSINIDALIDTGYIEHFITDFPYSTFPQYQSTERIDKAVASLMEGRLLILLDGTPTVSIAPVTFFSFFQAADDYSFNWVAAFFLRLIRIISVVLAVFLPALYVALVSFHYYAIPLDLIVTLSRGRARVPFTPIMEALFMEITIELLREAATRLPSYVGNTIGVVGGLVIGQAAVEAGIVGQLLLIVVAVTTIASYVIPNSDMALAIRLTRFACILFAGVFGMMGIVTASALIFAHLMVLESLGQPYFQPLAPFKIKDVKDTFIRLPMKNNKKRPDAAQPADNKRGT